jgi:hypothetical protein
MHLKATYGAEILQRILSVHILGDRLCGLVVRVLAYRSGGPGSIPGTTRFSEKKNKENK